MFFRWLSTLEGSAAARFAGATHDCASAAVERLRKAGYEAYFAGGCVRDRLLGRPVREIDIATSARPDDIERVFEVAEKAVNIFPGNYEDYRWRKEREAETVLAAAPAGKGPTLSDVPLPGAAEEKKNKRINPIRLKQMESRLAELEEEIARTETDISDCERALTVFVSADETQRQTRLLEERKSLLYKLMEEWEELSLAIEANA